MSGHEEQPQQQQQQQQAGIDDIIGASIVMPIARSNLFDFLYLSGIPISPFYGGGGGGGGGDGDGSGNQNQYIDMEQAVASILAGSLYERNPVKKVFDEEAATCEITDKKFTVALAEEMRINSACGIWQEEFEEGEAIKILPCNHAFRAEAIMKWLKEEKAECPMCRFVLKSKELLCHENREENDDGYSDSDSESESDSDGDAIAPQHEQEPEPELNNYAARINNIVSRMAQSVAGRMNHTQRHLPVEYEESISIPINRLIENRRNLISQARNVAASRAMPSSGGGGGGGAAARARVSAESYANAHREVRAAPPAANNDPNNDPNNNPPILNIINNNYYYNNNNIINNYNDDEDVVSNQEQADIEEAIRRSLEHV